MNKSRKKKGKLKKTYRCTGHWRWSNRWSRFLWNGFGQWRWWLSCRWYCRRRRWWRWSRTLRSILSDKYTFSIKKLQILLTKINVQIVSTALAEEPDVHCPMDRRQPPLYRRHQSRPPAPVLYCFR